MKICKACNGTGNWETECCNGSGGCSCQGMIIDMGPCNVCHGSGYMEKDANIMANVDSIRGLHFIGTGPKNMYDIWPNRLGRIAP